MDLAKKVKLRREELKLSQEQLAALMGYTSRSSINKIEKGRPCSQKIIARLAKALQVSVPYLMGWEDDIDGANNISTIGQTVRFPIIGSIAAGYNGEAMETYDGEEEWIPAEFLNGHDPKDFFVLRVKGSSMYPKFLDGDRVLVQRVTSVDSGSVAVVMYDTKEATLKRVRYVYGEDWLELIPENPEYQTKRVEGVDLEQCRVLGKVVKLIRDV